MSRAKTSHRIRRAKNARTGNQILMRKIAAALGRAAVKVACQRIERYVQQIRAINEDTRRFGLALHCMAQQAALATLRGAIVRGGE